MMKHLSDIDISAKRILLRLDLNVPVKDGIILDDTRIQSSLPSIRHCIDQGVTKVMLMSHFGRPDAGKSAAEQPEFSLAPLAKELSTYLGQEVVFAPSLAAAANSDGTCILIENVRFLPGETKNDPTLAQEMADLCDVFIMDAFGSAHRAHSSTVGVTRHAPSSAAGFLLAKEIAALEKVLKDPARPLLAVVGGAKVGDKLKLLENLSVLADILIVGGGIANTFLAASGKEVGKSLYEQELMSSAGKIMEQTKVLLPCDVVVASSLASVAGETKSVGEIDADDMVLDIGQKSLAIYGEAIASAGTIIWNGPLGVFEQEAFAGGTEGLVKLISSAPGYCLAGGGETIAAINKFGGKVDYISTGGGAFLQYLEQGGLPAVTALEE